MVFPMDKKRLGPRGGETTVSKSGMVRKTLWLHADEAETLRERAYRERRSEAEILREALRQLLGLED
jgi:Ribbon-helix-helix protein, copG family